VSTPRPLIHIDPLTISISILSDESTKPNAAFLEGLAARINAGPPKKPVGLVKKPTHSADTDKDEKPHLPAPGQAGGIGGLAAAMAAAAASKGLGDAKEDDGAKEEAPAKPN